MSFRIRELDGGDLPFLREMLYTALFWRPGGERIPFEAAMAHPYVAMYHGGWGREGDAGYVAEEDGRLLGATWYRLFTEDEHGDGYVDPQTPELAVAVIAEARRRGVGRALMQAMTERARRDGIARIGISVNRDNPARLLYTSLGYRDVAPDDPHERMTLDVGAAPDESSAGPGDDAAAASHDAAAASHDAAAASHDAAGASHDAAAAS